jgi:hypothetical protein
MKLMAFFAKKWAKFTVFEPISQNRPAVEKQELLVGR